MTALALNKQLEICNAVNAAIAKGWTVNVEQDGELPFTIRGAIMREGDVVGITSHGGSYHRLEPDKRIYATMTAKVIVDTIYEPVTQPIISEPNSGETNE